MFKLGWLTLITFILCSAFPLTAQELSIKGIIDTRAIWTDSLNSYIDAGFGKFQSSDGEQLSISQLGVDAQLEISDNWTLFLIGNAYLAEEESKAGVTEAFVRYKGLPDPNGWRFSSKLGVYYPAISAENKATAWASPLFLTSSMQNSWVGEELRNTGVSVKFELLKQYSELWADLSIEATVFYRNDVAGALLSWHGWTLSNRQIFFNESRAFPAIPALAPGRPLQDQASLSEPFLELDDDPGAQIQIVIKPAKRQEFAVGYYNNGAEKGLVREGQYSWPVSFIHGYIRYQLSSQLQLLVQTMYGNIAMHDLQQNPVVDNDFSSAFVSVTHRQKQRRFGLRIETFDIDDRDETWGDNNNESGMAVTAHFSYQLNRRWFAGIEWNWVDSDRPARAYLNQPVELIEQQVQIYSRVFF